MVTEFGLLPTFSTWAHVTMLHMYLVIVRLRTLEPTAHSTWQSQLVDHFFHEAEAKMDVVHDLGSRMIRHRYLKDLFEQWRGAMLAYDEGIAKGDAELADALWRNLFKANEDIDLRVLAATVGWVRYTLRELDAMADIDLPVSGHEVFAKRSPLQELKSVDRPAPMLEKAFVEAGLATGAPAGGAPAAEAVKVAAKAAAPKGAGAPTPSPAAAPASRFATQSASKAKR